MVSSTLFGQTTEFDCKEKVQFESEIYDEKREYWIGFPKNFDAQRPYPVVYVLDCEWRFDITHAICKELYNNDKMPEVLVVGVPQINWEHRLKDMTFTNSNVNGSGEIDTLYFFNDDETSGGLTFLNHLHTEVIDDLNIRYKTNGFNCLIGHSLGGYFAAYVSQIESKFQAFQIYDPSAWFNEGDVINEIKENLSRDSKINIFLSSATAHVSREENLYHIDMIDSLRVTYEEFDDLRFDFKEYSEEDHNSMILPSLIDGLSFLFDGCEYGFVFPDDPNTLDDIIEHYRKSSERMGVEFPVSMDVVRWLGFAKHSQEDWKHCIEALLYCYEAFEDDINVNQELADSYLGLGMDKEAEIYLKKIEELR